MEQNEYLRQRQIATSKLNDSKSMPHWVVLHGYLVNQTELAKIFNINMHTLRQRINAGWPIEASLCADMTESRWTIDDIQMLQCQHWVHEEVKHVLDLFFAPPKRKYKRRSK